MNKEIAYFIKENEILIQNARWEEIYKKDFPEGFTETLLEAGINPLEQGLKYIPSSFLYKSEIKEFTIPNNIKSIDYNAFSWSRSLTNIMIPDSVENIGEDAFSMCDSLPSVIIPNRVTSIGEDAFYNCSSLERVVIGDNITSIENWTFNECTSLTSIIIPNRVTSIGEEAFYNCNSLTSIKYLGTKKEAIQLGIGDKSNKRWREESYIEKILCTDGIIEL